MIAAREPKLEANGKRSPKNVVGDGKRKRSPETDVASDGKRYLAGDGKRMYPTDEKREVRCPIPLPSWLTGLWVGLVAGR